MPTRDVHKAKGWRWSLLSASVILLVSGGLALREYSRFARASGLVEHTYEVVDAIDDLVLRFVDAEMALRGYLLTGEAAYLEAYTGVESDAPAAMDRLTALVRDNPAQGVLASELRGLAMEKLRQMAVVVARPPAAVTSSQLEGLEDGRDVMAELRAVAGRMREAETALLARRSADAQRARRTALMFAIASLMLAGVVAGVAVSVQRSFERRREAHEREYLARQEAEEAARLSAAVRHQEEQINRRILDSTADYLVVLDGRGYFRSMNRVARQVEGVDDVVALRDQAWSSRWQDVQDKADAAIDRALAGSTGHFRAPRLVRKPEAGESERRWWDVLVNPLGAGQAQMERVVVVARDVTEQHRSEALLRESELRFRTIADALPQLVWSTAPDGIPDYFNERWYEYVSPASAPRTNAMGWKTFVHPDDVGAAVQAWTHCISSGTPYLVEYRLRRHDGIFRWFIVRALPLRDDQGDIVRWFGTCTDIDDQKRADEERAHLLSSERAARSEAERAARMKDEFVSTLSHELRTPLNAILGWVGVLRRDSSADTLQKAIETIDRNSRRQSQMIDDLLDVSRIISGKMRLDVQRVDLAPVIEEALTSATPAADAKGVRLVTVLGSAAIIEGDPGRLQQVVWNIVSNAIKFTSAGGRVQVTLRKVNSHVHIEVSDTGAGIRPELLPHVFERFRQEDGSAASRAGGLGLGLAIAKNLTEMHGGAITATSDGEGHGSVFTVRLPLALAHYASQDTTGCRDEASAELTGLLTGVTVVVLDDEPDARELATRLLEDAGAEVVAVGSAKEALDVIGGGRTVSVILSDIGLTDVDGYQFMQTVRQLDGPVSRVPAIALTALARVSDRKRALLSGYQAHLAKPVDPTELVAMVASVAGKTGLR